MHLLLQFYADFFETLQMLGYGLKVCIFFVYNPHIILSLFYKINLVKFQTSLHSKLLDSRYLVCATPTLLYVTSGGLPEDMHVLFYFII